MALQTREVPDDPRIRLLLKAYRDAQRTILLQVRAAIDSGDIVRAGERRRLLASVLDTLNRLGVETDREAAEAVAAMYRAGAAKATAKVPGASVENVTALSFGSVNTEAVQALQDSLTSRLDDARRTIGRQVNDVFAAEQRRATVQALLGADNSPARASATMRARLRQQGVTAFIDKSGRRWSLEDYADMAVRTVTREAVVAGAVNSIATAGIDLVQVTTHASSCPICQPYEGQIMSLSGSTDEVPGVQVSELVLPPFHPRCAHTVSPYVPALALA